MGLRCSLLGHDYGESFVERDREERGNEVVVTERELQECARCGAERVTSENTEVRSLEPDPEPATEETASTPDQQTEQAATANAGADDSGGSGAFTSATDAIEQAEAGAGASTEDAGGAADADPDGEDAVILDDDADDGTPGSDQWDEPEDEVDPTDAPEPTADPDEEDVEFVDAGPDETTGAADTQSAETDAQQAGVGASTETADAGGTQAAAAETDRPRGEWPEPDGEDEGFDATDGDAEDAAFEFGDDEEFVEADTGFTSAGPVESSDGDDLDFELYCPECGFERYAAGSSLRAGDICPECKRGYLAEDR
ncbi:DUF7093 family protein [Halobacterium litoreum]|uniref:Oxidoreductase n=1 Tax=Halobacterium litoreum TaxID=2039234 RepID=A0ABD5NFM4_9EURY|nr:hypothetical protein [Halobacterium litoreum]UHH12997.1 hypothetical protein LT972_12645 [Halobacterium litoreum]